SAFPARRSSDLARIPPAAVHLPHNPLIPVDGEGVGSIALTAAGLWSSGSFGRQSGGSAAWRGLRQGSGARRVDAGPPARGEVRRRCGLRLRMFLPPSRPQGQTGVRLSLNHKAAYRKLRENDRAERSPSPKRLSQTPPGEARALRSLPNLRAKAGGRRCTSIFLPIAVRDGEG